MMTLFNKTTHDITIREISLQQIQAYYDPFNMFITLSTPVQLVIKYGSA